MEVVLFMNAARKALMERQKKYLKEKFGIETHEQLLEELKKTKLDISIFVMPLEQATKAS